MEATYGAPPARPTTKPATRPEPTAEQQAEHQARHDLFRTTFAEELGVTADELKAAELAVAEAHLAEEVAAGRITQAEADARLEAMADGTAPGPGGPGHGHHGGPDAA